MCVYTTMLQYYFSKIKICQIKIITDNSKYLAQQLEDKEKSL